MGRCYILKYVSSAYLLFSYSVMSSKRGCLIQTLRYLDSFFSHYNIGISSFPGAGDVWFSLRNTTYQNNSIVTLEDIGEGDDALLCITNYTACCRHPASGNWFFPNGTKVPSSGRQWDFHRTRGRMVVYMHRRRGGVEGIYRCVIPDTFGFFQTLYIGVYSASTGEWYVYRVYN